MKYSFFVITVLVQFFSSGAYAFAPAAVQCTLTSGKTSHSQTAKLEPDKEDMMLSDSGFVHDLSFDLIATCATQDCDIAVTFYSGKLEDEAGQVGWQITPDSKAAGVFFSEEIEGTRDGRDYRFECSLLK